MLGSISKNITKLSGLAILYGCLSVTGVAADDLQKIKDAGELSVAMTGQYPPFSFVNESNEVVGFDAAIGKAIADKLGVKAKIVTTPFDGIIAGLRAGKYDIIVASTAITPERAKAVDFAGPYYHAGRAIVVKHDSPITSLNELDGKVIGVILGDTHEKWARGQGSFDLRTYKALPEMLMELNNNRIQAIIMDRIPVMVATKKTGQKIKTLETPDIEGASISVGIPLRKNNPELKQAIQTALDEMMSDGTYEKISMEWIGSDIR
ncbi:L-cystine-binding protein FliY [Pseudochrobactrum sp. MP213Fo]